MLALLQGRQALVVIDNCEHVLDAAAEVIDDLTSSAPMVTVLATSRETLALDGERVLPAAAAVERRASTRRRSGCSWIGRWHAIRPSSPIDRSWTRSRRCATGSKGRRWPSSWPPAGSRSSGRPTSSPTSTTGWPSCALDGAGAVRRRSAPRSSGATRCSIADEQAALRRLAVFDGSFDAAAAEAVVGLGSRSAVIDFLESAAAKSLVVVEPWSDGSGARFSLLDTIRAFGLERLAEAGEERGDP